MSYVVRIGIGRYSRNVMAYVVRIVMGINVIA